MIQKLWFQNLAFTVEMLPLKMAGYSQTETHTNLAAN